MMRWYVVLVFLAVAATTVGANQDLLRKLAAIDARKDKEHILILEEECLQLLPEARDQRDRGQVYYQLAELYEMTGAQRKFPERQVSYARKALTYPLGTLEKVRMLNALGNGLYCEYLKVRNTSRGEAGFPAARKEIASAFLDALKLAGSMEGTASMPTRTDPFLSIPVPSRKSHGGHSPMQEHARGYRQMLQYKVAVLYARPPQASDELHELAKLTLQDRQLVEELEHLTARLTR